eukprot:814989-Prymnesium_polylepis.1
MHFVLENRVINRIPRLHGASEAPLPPCAAASAMHHGAASFSRSWSRRLRLFLGRTVRSEPQHTQWVGSGHWLDSAQ